MHNEICTTSQVLRRTGLTSGALKSLLADPTSDFPRPLKRLRRRREWPVKAINDWIFNRPVALNSLMGWAGTVAPPPELPRPEHPRFVRERERLKLTGVSRSHFRRLELDATAPPRHRITDRCIAWYLHELQQFNAGNWSASDTVSALNGSQAAGGVR